MPDQYTPDPQAVRLVEEAQKLIENGDYDGAFKKLKEAKTTDPYYPGIYLTRARLHSILGNDAFAFMDLLTAQRTEDSRRLALAAAELVNISKTDITHAKSTTNPKTKTRNKNNPMGLKEMAKIIECIITCVICFGLIIGWVLYTFYGRTQKCVKSDVLAGLAVVGVAVWVYIVPVLVISGLGALGKLWGIISRYKRNSGAEVPGKW